MSGFPPPPPQPSAYDRNAAKAQRQAWQAQQKAYAQAQKQQARFQRHQFRMQTRIARRGSLVGPLLLIGLGVVCLLTQTGKLSWGRAANWYGHWWPAVLILAGLLLIAEWTIARQRQQAGAAVAAPALGGGLVFLLILLASVGFSMGQLDANADWHHWVGPDFGRMMGESHDFDDALASPVTAGESVLIRSPHGDVIVTGSSADGQVHLSVHKEVHAWSDSDAENRANEIQPHFSTESGQLILTVPGLDGAQSDLTLEVPHDSPLTVENDRGDITVSEIHAPLNLTASHGSVEMSGIDGVVNIHMNYDDGSVNGHSITGPVTLQGRSGEINFADIAGPVTLQGDFFGSTHLERVNGIVRFLTSRTQFEAQRLDGEFEVDTGADLQASQLLGPVKLTTRNRNIELDRVAGHVEITNRNGSITVTNAPPFAGLQIINDRGSVDVGLPTGANFVLAAQTRHGSVENDFGIDRTGSSESPTLNGSIGTGGPLVSIVTSNGDVTVRKSTVAPLPPAPPAPPKVTAAPPAPPAAPVAPVAPVSPKVKSAKPKGPKLEKTPAPHPPAAAQL